MLAHNLQMLYSVETGTAHVVSIRSVAFDDSAIYLIDNRFDEFRTQEILIAAFARVKLYGDIALQFLAKLFVQSDQ